MVARLSRSVACSGAAGQAARLAILLTIAASALPTAVAQDLPTAESRPSRGWLGVFFGDSGGSAILVEVVPDSPAARAGLRPGELLRTLGGQSVDSAAAAILVLATKRSGASLEIVVESATALGSPRKKRVVQLELAAPPPEGPRPGSNKGSKPRVGKAEGGGAPPPASPAGESVAVAIPPSPPESALGSLVLLFVVALIALSRLRPRVLAIGTRARIRSR